MEGLTFAPATEEDVAAVLRWNTELIDRYEDPALIDRDAVLAWCERKASKRLGEYSRIVYRGEHVGYIRRCTEGGQLELDDLYIDPAYQGKGIGSAVLRRCIQEAGQPVYLYVFTRNTRAISLYERLGFRVAETVNPTRVIMRLEGR